MSPRSTGILWAELIEVGSLGRARSSLSCLSTMESLAQTDTQSKLSGLCCSAAGRGYDGKQRLSMQAEKLWQGRAEMRQLQINYYKSSDSICVKEQPLTGQVQVTHPVCLLH